MENRGTDPMETKLSGNPVRRPRRLLFMLCGCLAVASFSALILPTGSVKATDCTAVVGVSPAQAPTIDCPLAQQPCPPNDCMCYQGSELIGLPGVTYPNGSATQGGGCGTNGSTTYNAASHCGPITACMLLGSDPPITNKEWDEPIQGYPSLGNFLSGKCPPTGASGMPANSGGYVVCPTTNNTAGR
jgi:hypothetical protein